MLTDEQLTAFDVAVANLRVSVARGELTAAPALDHWMTMFAAGIAYAQTWRSMESAPQTNGEPLLVQTLSGVPMLVTRDDACWYDWHTNRQLDEAHFIGWLPLPPTEAK